MGIMRHKGRRSGFTLVELLVVISIIIILASIVVPVTMQIAAQSRITYCANNLRQIHAALFNYAQTYDQRFPGHEGGYVIAGVLTAPAYYPYRYATVFPIGFDPNELRGDDDLSPLFAKGFAADIRVFNCPSTTDSADPKRKDSGGNELPEGYDLMYKATERHCMTTAEFQMDAATGPYGQLSYEYIGEVAPGLHLGEIDANLAWLAYDIDDRDVGIVEGKLDDEVDGDNHGTAGGNMLFIDGRVDWIPAASWRKTILAGHDVRLANVDMSTQSAAVPEGAVRGEWDKVTGWPNPALDVDDFFWGQVK